MREFREIEKSDVGKETFRFKGRMYPVCDFIGQIFPSDIGKRVYLIDGILQVENDEQRAARGPSLMREYVRV